MREGGKYLCQPRGYKNIPYDKYHARFKFYVKEFINSSPIAIQNLPKHLKITGHSLRKCGIRLLNKMGLSDDQIKFFSGHSKKSHMVADIYNKESYTDCLINIAQQFDSTRANT